MRGSAGGWLVVVVMWSLAPFGCSKHEQTITASYGRNAIAGAVTLGDGSDPAGIEVTVLETGMSTLLDAEGSFAFVGIPKETTLRFRRGDGIDETHVATSGSAVRVQLRPPTQSFPAGSAPEARRIEGNLAGVTAMWLVVTTSRGDVSVELTPETQFRRGGTPLSLADLGAGDDVVVQIRVREGAATAVRVDVRGDEQDAPGKALMARGPRLPAGSGWMLVQSPEGRAVAVSLPSPADRGL